MYAKALLQTFLFSAIVLAIHFGLSMILEKPSLEILLLIHGVLFLLTFGGFALLLAINKFDANKLGFAFLALSTIKLLIAASLILILVKVWDKPKDIAIHFAGMYFVYILFLALQTFKLLNKK